MKVPNWKTLLGGLVAGLPPVIGAITPMLPAKYQAVISGLGMIWLALFAKDNNVTGGTVKQ
jgi:hypothetical protein